MEKRERLLQAAAIVLDAAPEKELNAVTLNKALFYLDLAVLRDTGHTVTNNSYIALENGPVVAQYVKRLIRPLEERGVAKQEERWDGAKPVVLVSTPVATEIESPDVLALAAKISRHFAGMTSKQASDYSHQNMGWQIAWDKYAREGKPSSINMQIAMQQIIEDDPWMHVPLTGEERKAIDFADRGEGDDW